MDRGREFELRVGDLFEALRAQYPKHVTVTPQYPAQLSSGRRVLIDFRMTVDFAHEKQAYYFELQSRDKHSHELSDKVEAIRRDTRLSTFSFVHESPLSDAVAAELRARNIVTYDWDGLVRFMEGIELQLLQLVSAERMAMGLVPHDTRSGSRLVELVERLAKTRGEKSEREFRGREPTSAEADLVNEIAKEVARDPGEVIRQAKRLFGL